MSKILEYKGFYGNSQVSVEDDVIYGQLLYVTDLITYEADSVGELKKAFQEAVDDYIVYCEKIGKEPEKPFKGTFNVRISPEKHRFAVILAEKEGISLNQLVDSAISNYLETANIESREHQKMLTGLENLSYSVTNLNNNFAAFSTGYFATQFLEKKRSEVL